MLKLFISIILFLTIVLTVFAEDNCDLVSGTCPCGVGKQSKIDYYNAMNSPLRARRKRALVARKAYEGDWPWAVAVIGSKICSGTIIGDKYVLTAAHCVKAGEKVKVGYGGVDIKRLQYQVAKKIKIHEGFKQFSDFYYKDDVAILELEKPIKKTGELYEICIRKGVQLETEEYPVFAGFGEMFYKVKDFARTKDEKTPIKESEKITTDPDFLRETPVPVIPCDQKKTTSDSNQLKNLVCTGISGHGTTNGDAGGPLMVIRDDKWVLYGISSTYWNTGISEDLLAMIAHDVYVKVEKYCDWITQNTYGSVKCV